MKPPRPERLEFHLPAELPGVVTAIVENSPQHFRWFHETYSVATMLGGGGTWACDGRTHETVAGTLSLWQPGDAHAVRRLYADDHGDALTTQRLLLLEPALVTEAAELLGLPPDRLRLKVRIERSPAVHRVFQRFHRSIEDPDASPLERESRLARCIDLLVRGAFETSDRAAAVSQEKDAVNRVRRMICERYADPLRLDELAEAGGLDRFRLIRSFVASVGFPPHQFQLVVRMSRARTLLAKRRPAAEVAADLGFADQSHFIRAFRRFVGVTPGRFGRA